ncbi:MAG: TlpA disulfide reductase family protein [Algibacter sp.]
MFFFGQVKISKNIQGSAIAESDENVLYFVDFWATWCGPCIHASKYLESLQKQFPKDFYIVSLSQENAEVVKRFMLKHNIKLAVAIDYQGETFAKNNIQSLPYGILYNADGKKLWEGHAADLKNYNIKGYLETNKKKVSVASFFNVQKYEEIVLEKEETIKKDFVYYEDRNIEFESSEIQIINKETFIELRGSLQDIMSYNLRSYKGQVKISTDLNKYYSMRFKKDSNPFFNKEKFILKALKLKKIDKEQEGDVLVLNVDSPNFWDTNQIDWGTNNQQFLIGDSDIQADNVTLNEIAYKLSGLLEIPIVFNKAIKDDNLHDWQIHYKYFEFMTSNLGDYGIKVEKKVEKYSQYVYTLK